jgi:diguanylate cyclase (GGDEF)-like protein
MTSWDDLAERAQKNATPALPERENAFMPIYNGPALAAARLQSKLAFADAAADSPETGEALWDSATRKRRDETTDALKQRFAEILTFANAEPPSGQSYWNGRDLQKLLVGHLLQAQTLLETVLDERERLYADLLRTRRLSLTDECTGLPNRRGFMNKMEEEISRAQRYDTPLTVALLDLDAFKSVNDAHGHAGGDEVLRLYSSEVLSIVRHHDYVARYGGEEFAVLLPNTDHEGAVNTLAKVRARALEVYAEYGGKSLPMPTFSAGLTLYVPGESPHSLLERADSALYCAKRNGRNRTEVSKIAVSLSHG